VTFESNAYSSQPLGDEFEAAQTTLKESVMTNGVTLKIGVQYMPLVILIFILQ